MGTNILSSLQGTGYRTRTDARMSRCSNPLYKVVQFAHSVCISFHILEYLQITNNTEYNATAM
jgi:hypothetical protein